MNLSLIDIIMESNSSIPEKSKIDLNDLILENAALIDLIDESSINEYHDIIVEGAFSKISDNINKLISGIKDYFKNDANKVRELSDKTVSSNNGIEKNIKAGNITINHSDGKCTIKNTAKGSNNSCTIKSWYYDDIINSVDIFTNGNNQIFANDPVAQVFHFDTSAQAIKKAIDSSDIEYFNKLDSIINKLNKKELEKLMVQDYTKHVLASKSTHMGTVQEVVDYERILLMNNKEGYKYTDINKIYQAMCKLSDKKFISDYASTIDDISEFFQKNSKTWESFKVEQLGYEKIDPKIVKVLTKYFSYLSSYYEINFRLQKGLTTVVTEALTSVNVDIEKAFTVME